MKASISSTVASFGMLIVLEIAPVMKGCAALEDQGLVQM